MVLCLRRTGQQAMPDSRYLMHPPFRRIHSPLAGSYMKTAPAKNAIRQPDTTASDRRLTCP
jgi:hypothetical protein